MSDKIPAVPRGSEITQEQLDAISGGSCTAADLTIIVNDLQKNYETLIEFTSYVIERVAGTPQ